MHFFEKTDCKLSVSTVIDSVNGLNTYKIKASFHFRYFFLLTLRVAAECCFQIYCRISWHLASGEC